MITDPAPGTGSWVDGRRAAADRPAAEACWARRRGGARHRERPGGEQRWKEPADHGLGRYGHARPRHAGRCRGTIPPVTDHHAHVNLSDVEDAAPGNGLDHRWEARVARQAVGAEATGLTHFRLKPGKRSPFYTATGRPRRST